MQEEVESRTVNLAISTSKLTARTIVSAVRGYLNHRKTVSARKAQTAEKEPSGKQTVKELLGQGQGVTNIDIAKTDLRGFESVARKYGIDYALKKDKAADLPRYFVFFRARDEKTMEAAFKEYSEYTTKEKKPSVKKKLTVAMKRSAPQKAREREKKKERTTSR